MEKRLKFISNEFLIISLILVVTFFTRLIPYLGQDYPMGNDGYKYLQDFRDGSDWGPQFFITFGNILGIEGMTYLLIFISCITSILFYILCRRYTDQLNSLLASFLFSISPLIFFNNQFGLYDKNIPSLFMIILGILIMSLKNKKLILILLVPYFIAFRFVWEGFFAMLVLIAIYYTCDGILKNKWYAYVIGLVGTLASFIFGYSKFRALTNPSDWVLISELNPIWNIGFFTEYLLLIIVWILVFTKIRLEKHDKELISDKLFLYLGFVIMFFFMTFVFRLNLYFFPFMYLWIAILLQDLDYNNMKKIFSIGIISIIIIFTSFNIYFANPIANDDMVSALNYIDENSDKDCIVGVWSNGHIYDFYSEKEILFKASAGKYIEQLEYMVYGNRTSKTCSYIWDNEDVMALEYMLIYERSNISREEFYILKLENNTTNFGKYKVLI